MSSADGQNPMRGRLRLVSSTEMVSPAKANRARERAVTGAVPSHHADMAASGSTHAGRAADAAAAHRRPGLNLPPMPGLSANHLKFLAIMSGSVAGTVSGQAGDAHENASQSARREDDPAFAVGTALFMWRYCRRGLPMPRRVMQLLERHASAGDPTCILVRDWLRTRMAGSAQRFFRVLEGGRQS